jgi:hypothetical protein
MNTVIDQLSVFLFLIAVASAPVLAQSGSVPSKGSPSTLNEVAPNLVKAVKGFGPLIG